MELTHAIQHRLVQSGVMLDADTGIFGGKFVEGVCESLFVTAPFWFYCEPVHGRREVDGTEVVIIFVVGVVEHIIEADLVDLGDTADVAWDAQRYLRGFLT
jgi:hypothetical protein